MVERLPETHLANGVRVVVLPAPHFRIRTVRAIFQLRMGEATAAQAVASMVLERGTRPHPETLLLAAALENLYGADISTDVAKVGDAHLVMVDLAVPSDRFLPEGVFEPALDLLKEVVCDPALEDGHFRPDYVTQERASLERTLEGIFNDKAQYAQLRLLETMFGGEPYSMSRYGTVAQVRAVTPGAVMDAYRRLIETAPLSVYAVGDMDPAAFTSAAGRLFAALPPRAEPKFEAPHHATVTAVRREDEAQDVAQGKLVLGYRTGIDIFDASWTALSVANGIFGAYAHSKLFQNVREKASLAYSCYSRLDGFKGIMLVHAGIEPKKRCQAEEIIERQLADVKAGQFTDEEMEMTVRAMENQILAMADSPSSLIMTNYELALAGRPVGTAERLAALRRVRRDDVVRAARTVDLDTVYFLTRKAADR